jgi:hypothetical protein
MYAASKDWLMVMNEMGRMWKETVVVCSIVLSRYMLGGTERNHERFQ